MTKVLVYQGKWSFAPAMPKCGFNAGNILKMCVPLSELIRVAVREIKSYPISYNKNVLS